MPKFNEAAQFAKHLGQLITRRETYQRGLAEIDSLFARFGISFHGSGTQSTGKRRGRPPGSGAKSSGAATTMKKTGGKRKRRRFDQTAEEFVIGLVKNKEMTTGEINKAWKAAGRGGASDNTLGKLVSEKKLKRTPVKDGRGSSYSAT